jgi:hypothetical protein
LKILRLLPALFLLTPAVAAATEHVKSQPYQAMSLSLSAQNTPKSYAKAWQRRLIEIQTEFAATLRPAVDNIETGSITSSAQ